MDAASVVAAKKNSLARFVLESTPTYEFGKLACCKQGCHSDGRIDMFVCLSCLSDKALLHQIRVNAMLTFDRIKLELLCPWGLPHWIVGYKLPLYYRGWGRHGLVGVHMTAWGGLTAARGMRMALWGVCMSPSKSIGQVQYFKKTKI